MQTVRGTFKVIEQTRWDWARKASQVKLESVAGGKEEEATALNAATVAASISMMITNPKLVKLFAPGKHFAVDFQQVPAPRGKRKTVSKQKT